MRTKLSKIAHILLILIIGAIGVQTITSCSGGDDDGGGGGDPSSSSRGGGGGTSSSYSPNLMECGTELYDAANKDLRCQDDVIETKCGSLGWYDATDEDFRCPYGAMLEFKCGTNWYNGYYYKNFRCQNEEIEFKCGTDWYNPLTQFCSGGNTLSGGSTLKDYGFITDTRDSKTYKIVEIGTQTWMAENLNYNATGSKCGGIDSKLKDENTENCDIYGRLYDWSTALTACLVGWHLPSDAEWDALTGTVLGGSNLKAVSGWYINGNGTDGYGFSALPGGLGYSGGGFQEVGKYGYWWNATESNGVNYAYLQRMYYGWNYVESISREKRYLYSVRCVRD